MGHGPYQKFLKTDAKIIDIEKNPAYRVGSKFLRELLLFITWDFHPSYTEAFKGYMTTTVCCNVKTTKTTLLQKNKHDIYCNGLTDNELDQVSSSSVHMCYPHCRICDLLGHGFERHYFHNTKSILGTPSKPNNFNPND